jgi:hypothetical protein
VIGTDEPPSLRAPPRFVITRLLLAAAALAAGSGCIGPSANELHDAARSLVPPGSEVVAGADTATHKPVRERSPGCLSTG